MKKMDEAKAEMQKVALRVKMRYPLLRASFYGTSQDARHTEAMKRYYEMDLKYYLDSQEEKKNV